MKSLFYNLNYFNKLDLLLDMYSTERLYEALNNMTPVKFKKLKQIALFATWFYTNNR